MAKETQPAGDSSGLRVLARMKAELEAVADVPSCSMSADGLRVTLDDLRELAAELADLELSLGARRRGHVRSSSSSGE